MSRLKWLVVLALLALTACASRQAQVQDAETEPPLPEVRKITFTGNETFGAGALRGAMATVQRPLFPPWKRGEVYNRPTLNADLQRLKKFYFDRGFLQTTVRVEQVNEDLENHTVRIAIAIAEGPPTLVQDVRLAGAWPAALLDEAKVLRELPLRRGERITKKAFDDSKAMLLRLMQDASYARAEVVPQTEVDTEKHEAIVTFTLQPVNLTRFGQITIMGNRQVKTRAIARQIEIRRSELYSKKTLTDTAEAIYGLGMFQAVTLNELSLEEPDNPSNIEPDLPWNIQVVVRERKPRTIEFGIGASSVDRFRIRVAWTHRNVFGGAERLTFEGKLASFVQEANASLQFPYFLARRTRFTQTLFVRNEEEFNTDPLGLLDSLFAIEDPQPDFDLFSMGGISRVEHGLSKTWSAAAGLDLSYNDFRQVDASSEINTEDNILFIQFAELTWDTSNDLLNPTRGMLLRGRFDHATTALLSDVSFVKLLFEARHYQPIWWRMILATRLVLGGIQPYGASDDVPQNVRFFSGGPGSVRGFAKNRLGPLSADNDPLGGNSLIEGSVELRFPIMGNLWGALFVDFGNVYRQALTYRLADLRYAVGPGVRYFTPIGPIRIDFGIIMDRRDDEDFGRVEFSIGQAF